MGTTPPATPLYPKPFLTIADQLNRLECRGLHFSDRTAAQACLERIGYYRLSGYWYPFRKSHLSVNPATGVPLLDAVTRKQISIVEDDFKAGSTFQQVMDLYVFDKRLRLIILDAIERVEIALRVDLATMLGQRAPLAHRDPMQFDHQFGRKKNSIGKTSQDKWLDKLDESFRRSGEEFVTHFRNKYPGAHPPIWVAIELWDFGMLSTMINGLLYADRTALAAKYSLPRPELLTSIMRNLNNVRNMCAHHNRFWNRSPADRLSPPKSQVEIPLLNHLIGDIRAQSRIYATAAFLQFLIKRINPSSKWADRLKDHMKTLPASNGIDPLQAGFPHDWESLPLWQ